MNTAINNYAHFVFELFNKYSKHSVKKTNNIEIINNNKIHYSGLKYSLI